VVVLQGERQFSKDNKRLGNFQLTGIPPAPRGVPQIEVTFNIGAEGILSVTANDKGTHKQQEIKITGASTLSDAEVSKMVADAEAHAAEDTKRRESVDVKVALESLIYQAERQLKDLDPDSSKMPVKVRGKAETAIENAKSTIESEHSVEEMNTAKDQLNDALLAVGSAIYTAQRPAEPDDTDTSKGPPEVIVEEAVFTDIKEKEKDNVNVRDEDISA